MSEFELNSINDTMNFLMLDNSCYRQRIEMAERLKKEEEERLARRKRVEAIMLRTRGKNQSNTPTKVLEIHC